MAEVDETPGDVQMEAEEASVKMEAGEWNVAVKEEAAKKQPETPEPEPEGLEGNHEAGEPLFDLVQVRSQ